MDRVQLGTGAQLLDILEAFDVDALFSSPGSEWPVMWEALNERSQTGGAPAAYTCRHEELAATMAIGYNRKSGKMPVLMLHTSIGVLKTALALRYAHHSGIPMVVLTGESALYGEVAETKVPNHWQRSQSDVGGPAAVARTFVKRSTQASAPDVLPGMLYDACRSATTPPYGPVLLSIPQEFLQMATASTRYSAPTESRGQPSRQHINELARILIDADRPLILTETIGQRTRNVDILIALAEVLALPVFEGSAPGYVNFPNDHRLYQGSVRQEDLDAADVIVAIGCKLPWYPASSRPSGIRHAVVIDEYTTYDGLPYWGLPVDHCFSGDVSATLERLLEQIRAMLDTGRADRQRRIEARRDTVINHHDERSRRLADQLEIARGTWPVDTRWLTAELTGILPQDAILLEEVTTDKRNVLQFSRRVTPGTFFARTSGGLGLIMGMALGVKLAAPKQVVVDILGDGGFHYSPALAAFGFAQEHPTPVLTVICNNESYASVIEGHRRYFPEATELNVAIKASRIFPPSYVELARAYGSWAAKVESPSDLKPTLREALDRVIAGQPALVDVPTAPGLRAH